MPTTAYISRRTVLPDSVEPAAVLVREERIVAIAPYDAVSTAEVIVDLGDQVLLPGLVDSHVHINEPGRTEWEGFRTATRAAAAGGVTTVIDMPLNCLPETTTVAALAQKRRAAADKCTVDWRAWGGAVGSSAADENSRDLEPLAHDGVAGFKCFLLYPGCEGLGLIDEAHLRVALAIVARTGLPLLVHAELPGPLEIAQARLLPMRPDWQRYSTYLASRPAEAELAAIRLLIELMQELAQHGPAPRVHIVHLSTALALPMLREAKAEGLPITVETCPHYLYFSAEAIETMPPERATLVKCAPPVRDAINRDLLWQAVLDGTIDLIASDHSPCPPQMKSASFESSWGGIASLSLGLPVMWQEGRRRGFSLGDVARLMSKGPALLGGLQHRKGSIAEGFDADLVVFAPDERFTVKPENLHFRHAVSPYLGEELSGVVHRTMLRGQTIFEDGRFPEQVIGREVSE